MAGLEEITAPPQHVTAEQLEQLQQATPDSFASIPPVLRLHLTQSTVYLSPSPSARPSCFQLLSSHNSNGNGAHESEEDEDEDAEVFQTSGQLWLTEREVAFLSAKTNSGFKLGYPNVALHAVTRSPPSFLAAGSSSSAGFHGCLYCQLDLSPNAGTGQMGDDEDEDGEFVEMYICTPDAASLDQLFEALSHCASLHPSGPTEDDGGHPFAGFAPFGTGASGEELEGEDDGAFDDAETNGDHEDVEGDEQELSETGRVRTDFQTPDSRFRPY